MTGPGLSVWLVSAYALALLGAAWLVDTLGSRSARRSLDWRHADFVYHDDVDGWKCHEDQWLWPTAFDPDKRVIRYAGAHAICGRCPQKDTCSPTPGPRELTRPVDPWPYSEAGRFHRGLALAIAVVGCFLSLFLMVLFTAPADRVLLAATFVVMSAGTYPLARHLWSTPENAPAHLPHIGSEALAADSRPDAAPAEPATRSGYRSVREAAELIAAARAEAERTGRRVTIPLVAHEASRDRAVREPELRHLAAQRRSTPDADQAPRRSWASAWNPATPRPAKDKRP